MSEEKEENTYGVPDDLKVKRKYTMSPKAHTARKKNAQLSTGPTSEEGKERSSKNAWKHGEYAQGVFSFLEKTCRKTCPTYPCSLVDEELVSLGDRCIDKQYMLDAFDAIGNALRANNSENLEELAAFEMAGSFDILNQIKEAIQQDGVLMKEEVFTKNGDHAGYKFKPHPLLNNYRKFLTDLGLTMKDFLLTPKEVAKANNDEESTNAIKTVGGLMAEAAGKVKPKDKGTGENGSDK